MMFLADDLETYGASVALLAAHSAISLNDAIQMGLRGKRSKYEDHRATIMDLQTICAEHRVKEMQGVEHLRWLLAMKTDIAYGDRGFAHVVKALDKARKFHSWAYNNFRGVLHAKDAS